MPLYYFDVANRVRLTDPDGTMLPNSETAFVHALQVVRELMPPEIWLEFGVTRSPVT